ncbi:MAG: CpaD family pilus assembly lipoprotein [Sphingomonadales bacterium]
MQTRQPGRLILAMLTAALGLTATACTSSHAPWTGAQTMKRNTVELVRMTHDINLAQDGTVLDAAERQRLSNFFDSIALGYGDELAIDPGDGPGADARWSAVGAYLKEIGLTVEAGRAVYGSPPDANSARIIVGRYIVTPPKCPNWAKRAERDFQNTPTSNMGCANTTNLGLMVANPRDLLEGRGELTPDTDLAARAVLQYRAGKTKKSGKDKGSSGGGK